MSWKTTFAIGATVLAGAIGVNQLLEVKTPEDAVTYRQEQQVEQGSDAVEKENDRRRDELSAGTDAENRRKLVPSEARPGQPHLKLRIRP